MTILHFSRSFGAERLGGAERNIYNLVNLLSSVHAEKNIVISDNGIWDYCKSKNTFINKNLNNLEFILLLIKNIKTKKISNIHVHSNGYYIFLGYFISIIIQCKLIIKVTRIGEGSLINRNKEKKFSFKLLIKRTLFKLICKSNNVYMHILSKSCLDITKNFTNKVIVFPNLIKKGNFNPDLKTKDTFVISSRLIKRKNIDLALDNLINLKNKNIKIFILGDGPELKRLKIKYNRYKSEILFLGYLKNEDINKYYAKAEYFVNESLKQIDDLADRAKNLKSAMSVAAAG